MSGYGLSGSFVGAVNIATVLGNIKMNAYDSWLEEPYQSSWDEDDDPRQEFCQDEYLTEDELMEEQYVLHCLLTGVSDE